MTLRFLIPVFLLFIATTATAQQTPGGTDRLFVHTDRDYYLAGEQVWLKMYCVQPPDTNEPKSAVGYIELANPNSITTVLKLKIALNGAGAATLNLPDSLPTGRYTLYAYTARSIDSGYFFKKYLDIQNTFDKIDTVIAPASRTTTRIASQTGVHLAAVPTGTLGRRQKIRLMFSMDSMPKRSLPAHLSLAVFRVDSLHSIPERNILPLFSATQMARLPLRYSDPEEVNGPVVTGSIQAEGADIHSNLPVFFSIPGRRPRYYGIHAENGRFAFDTYNFSGDATLLATAPGHKITLTVDDKFKNIVQYDTDKPGITPAQDSSLLSPLTRAHIAMQVNSAFYGDSSYLFDPFDDSLALRGHYDESVNLDDYTRFTTFEEVFREMIKTVMVRPQHDTLYLRALNNALVNPKFFDTPALVLLDGVPIFDSKKLFAIDPLKIKKVSVYAREIFMGPFRFTGVVLLQTYNGDLAGFPLDPAIGAADISGTANQQTFFSPDYATGPRETIPDQRSLLYWQPNLFTDTTKRGIEFYTSDLPGNYCAVLQGIDPRGEPCYATLFFEVQ